jgi:hypothetical protein
MYSTNNYPMHPELGLMFRRDVRRFLQRLLGR